MSGVRNWHGASVVKIELLYLFGLHVRFDKTLKETVASWTEHLKAYLNGEYYLR